MKICHLLGECASMLFLTQHEGAEAVVWRCSVKKVFLEIL